MYRDHFGLNVLPFKVAPDPDFLFENSQNSRALRLLRLGPVLSPITVVTGNMGTGKTTLILNALKYAPENICTGLLPNCPVWADNILPWVLGAFEIPDGSDDVERFEAFRDFVEREHASGRQCVLIVDEAQNVSRHGLEQLRQLASGKLVGQGRFNLILVGQEELRERFRAPECSGLAQQIGETIDLRPLTAAETDAYIRHRLKVAGGRPDIFDPGATEAVHDISGGYPRLVNLVCHTAMIMAYGAGVRRIDRDRIGMIGDDILSDLLETVEKIRNVPFPKSGLKTMPAANSDLHDTGLGEDVFEFVSTHPRRDESDMRQIPILYTRYEERAEAKYVPATNAKSDVSVYSETDERAGENKPDNLVAYPLKHNQRSVPVRLEDPPADIDHDPDIESVPVRLEEPLEKSRMGGRRVLLVGTFAALVVAAGVMILNSGMLAERSRQSTEEVAALQSSSAAAPVELNDIKMDHVPALLTDMSGEAFLDRALSAGLLDPTAAAGDYARAALRGEDLAAYYLGQLYETGDGVPRDLARARSWYASVEDSVRGARRRLEALAEPLKAGELGKPTPLLGGALDSGGAEFVWLSGIGVDPAYFFVELSEGPSDTIRRLPRETRSALKVKDVGPARFWRVIAVAPSIQSYAVSDWSLLGALEAPVTVKSDGILANIVVEVPADITTKRLSTLTSKLEATLVPYRVKTNETRPPGPSGLQVEYFFQLDEAAARKLADALDVEAEIILATANELDQTTAIPGQILIRPGQP